MTFSENSNGQNAQQLAREAPRPRITTHIPLIRLTVPFKTAISEAGQGSFESISVFHQQFVYLIMASLLDQRL
jgi:hypothetical protein